MMLKRLGAQENQEFTRLENSSQMDSLKVLLYTLRIQEKTHFFPKPSFFSIILSNRPILVSNEKRLR